MSQSERPTEKDDASSSPPHDPLKGYRSKHSDHEYSELEKEVQDFRTLADTELNTELLRDVLRSDELLAELKDSTSTIKRLANHVTQVLDESCRIWYTESDPQSDTARDAHGNARAARLLLDWLYLTHSNGEEALDLLQQEEGERNG
jgi:hypothetical protein